MIFAILGILSAIVFLIGDIPYLRDTIKGKIKPHRVTWGVACLLNSISFGNQYASGATDSLWIFGAASVITGLVFLASLRNGVGGHTKLDILAIAAAVVGVGLWALFDSPVLSVLCVLAVVEASLIPTFIKAKNHPESETRIAWLCGLISSILAAISVGQLDWVLLVLPINGMLMQAYMTYLLYIRPRRLRRETAITPVHSPAELAES